MWGVEMEDVGAGGDIGDIYCTIVGGGVLCEYGVAEQVAQLECEQSGVGGDGDSIAGWIGDDGDVDVLGRFKRLWGVVPDLNGGAPFRPAIAIKVIAARFNLYFVGKVRYQAAIVPVVGVDRLGIVKVPACNVDLPLRLQRHVVPPHIGTAVAIGGDGHAVHIVALWVDDRKDFRQMATFKNICPYAVME